MKEIMIKNLIKYFLKLMNKKLVLRSLTRPSLLYAKKINQNPLVGVEIGVFDGHNALNILKTMNIKKLYLIDPWEKYKELDEEEIPNKYVGEENYNYTKNLLRKYEDKIVLIRDYSEKVFDKIPNNLDFVYIDGNHKYKYVKQDIENYFPKLKVGGVLGGHDIENGYEQAGHCERHDGVIKAFIKFINKTKLKPFIYAPDWWVVKGNFEYDKKRKTRCVQYKM